MNSGISRYNLYPGALKKYIETGYDSLGTGDKNILIQYLMVLVTKQKKDNQQENQLPKS